MAIDSVHDDYKDNQYKWVRCRAAAGGIDSTNGKKFVRQHSAESDADYKSRLAGGIYANYTGQTISGWVGAIFREEPVIDLPTEMEAMVDSVDGDGLSMMQLCKHAVEEVSVSSRVLFVSEWPVSIDPDSDITSNLTSGITPTIKVYSSENITFWEHSKVGGKVSLSGLVLKEKENVSEEEFGTDLRDRYRVFRLTESGASVQEFNEKLEPIDEEYLLRGYNGGGIDHIPVSIYSFRNNTFSIDSPPIYDIASVNIGHFVNSCDFEANLSVHSGATLVVRTSQSAQEFKEANPSGIVVGQNTGLQVSEDGGVDLVQLASAQAIAVEMESKEKRIVQLGAKHVSSTGRAETAEAARINKSSQNSTLETLSSNLEMAMTSCLKDCALFSGSDPDKILFKMSNDFWDKDLTPDQFNAMVLGMDLNITPAEDIVRAQQESGWIKDDSDPEEIIDRLSQRSAV